MNIYMNIYKDAKNVIKINEAAPTSCMTAVVNSLFSLAICQPRGFSISK